MDQPAHFTWKSFFGGSSRIEANFNKAHADHPAHDHEFMEIVVVVGGSCLHRNFLGEQRLGKGDSFLMRPGAWHSYDDCRNLALYNCCFYPGILGRELGWLIDDPNLGRLLWSLPLSPSRRGFVQLHLPDLALAGCRVILDKLCTLTKAGTAGEYHADRVGLLVLLLSMLGRQLPHVPPAAKITKPHPAALAALKLMDEDPSRTWDMKSLAAQVRINPDYLARMFGALAGLPPMAYLRRRRLEAAISLLVNSSHSISNVGSMVGWPDASYFTRRFTAEYGLSPSAYRARFFNHGQPDPLPSTLQK